MKTPLRFIAWASLAMAGVPFASGVATAGVRVCTFPGSPSTVLDQAVAREAFKTAGIAASLAAGGFDGSDDDGVSVKELNEALRHSCDVIAGFPRSTVADGSGSKLLFSRGYLRSGYVSVTKKNPSAAQTAANVVAATYASPAQLIAVQQRDVTLDIENTPELTVDAVVKGHARSAIVWYPAVVAYTAKHPQQQFDVAGSTSPYADWHLVFAFGANGTAMRQRIDTALDRMASDGRLAELTRKWALPESTQAAQPSQPSFAYRDGPASGRVSALRAQLASAAGRQHGGFIKVDSSSSADAPSFDSAQVAHGKSLYSGSCAKCHGAELQGVNAPALKGPAFAPAANAHLTIGGVFGYMASNMPADRPGKMKPQDYADIMSFLLYSNGYRASSAKLTADSARASSTPLNAGTSH
ncbi:transporter substrate-binding domain-containing protein [Paraburkholderia sp. BL10I2N1]|uniref:c-type cytochrome n=1 Tax=Paraburkholderia sp. BL10I2N1 TaxID=1938796 RepID=UPI00105C13DC|nr:transporter substrate-binding domain-containing protein [Paraburkholderia sp. BL10I2N1]